jgi:hypothetical protein
MQVQGLLSIMLEKEAIRTLFKEIGLSLEGIRAEFRPVNMVKILRQSKPNRV